MTWSFYSVFVATSFLLFASNSLAAGDCGALDGGLDNDLLRHKCVEFSRITSVRLKSANHQIVVQGINDSGNKPLTLTKPIGTFKIN